MKNFSQNSVKTALCGVVGSERNYQRVWDSSQQAKSVRQAMERTGRFTEKGTLFLCLLRKFFLLPTTPKKTKMTDFHKRKTLQSQKRLQRFFSRYSILAGQGLFSLTLNLCDLPRRGGDYPYSRIAHIVQQSVKLPPLGILPGGLL